MSSTVHVKNIASETSEKEVRDFFSFCGKISSISVTPTSDATDSSKSATVTFEKETAAKTALLLDNTQLGPAQVQVTSAASLDQIAGTKSAAQGEDSSDEVHQEDKPRSRILAEYLAHGYTVSDKAIERAIALDQQHGISSRFTKALTDFDSKYQASEKTRQMDQKYQVSEKAGQAWAGFSSYFDKAMGTPTGQRLRVFYQQGNKQVMDVHNEARHLANLKSGKPSQPQGAATAGTAGTTDEKTSHIDPETAGMEQLPGSNRTKCNCGADTGKCPCEPGQCACSSCPKNADVTASA